MEIWKKIKGYEGIYEISSEGRVKSLDRITKFRNRSGFRIEPERILKPGGNVRGYLVVSLTKNNKPKSHKIHRLVAIHFIDNPDNKPQVNHKDCNKKNNNLDNLEWSTNKENFEHAIANDLIDLKGIKQNTAKLTEKEVLEIISNPKSTRFLGKLYGVSSSTISNIKNRKLWTHITNGKEIKKGRNYNTKLTEDIILKIRAEEGMTLKEIGEKYGIVKGTVGKIRNRQIWKHT